MTNPKIEFAPLDTFNTVKVAPVAFTGATSGTRGDKDTASGVTTLFTVTGDVLTRIWGVCTTPLTQAAATAKLEVGVAGNTALLIAQTTATEIDANEMWTSAWGVQYEANELPTAATPAWNEANDGTFARSVSDGILHITSTSGYVYWYLYGLNIPLATGFTCEARIKVVTATGGYSVIPFDIYEEIGGGAGGGWVELKTDRVKLDTQGGESGEYLMDTTDDYHVYRLTYINNVLTLYVDGIQRIQLTDSATVGTFIDNIFWGNEGASTMDAYWDYVYYRTDGAYAPSPAIGDTLASVPGPYIIPNGLGIIETTSAQDINSGQIYYICLWRPLSPGSSVVAA